MLSSTTSAMIASIKMNFSLRRGKEKYSKFYKKDQLTYSVSKPLSKQENLKIIESNKKAIRVQSKFQIIAGIIIILMLSTIFTYCVRAFF